MSLQVEGVGCKLSGLFTFKSIEGRQEFKKVSMLLKHFKVMEQLLVCNRVDKGDGGKDEGGGSWLLPPQVLFTLPAVAAHTFHDSAATAAHHVLPASMPPLHREQK